MIIEAIAMHKNKLRNTVHMKTVNHDMLTHYKDVYVKENWCQKQFHQLWYSYDCSCMQQFYPKLSQRLCKLSNKLSANSQQTVSKLSEIFANCHQTVGLQQFDDSLLTVWWQFGDSLLTVWDSLLTVWNFNSSHAWYT